MGIIWDLPCDDYKLSCKGRKYNKLRACSLKRDTVIVKSGKKAGALRTVTGCIHEKSEGQPKKLREYKERTEHKHISSELQSSLGSS